VDFAEKLRQPRLLTFSYPSITLRRLSAIFGISGISAITFRSRIVTFSRRSAISSGEVELDEDDVADNSPGHDSLGAIPEYRLYIVEVLLARQELAFRVHEGGTAAVLSGNAADIGPAPGELADDDRRLVAGLWASQIVMPGHCASRIFDRFPI
jgi:hypothetical protein